MKYPPIPNALFIKNRAKLSGKLSGYSMAVVHSSARMFRNGDQYFPFRQNSDLFYLTGIEQEKTILFLFPEHPDPCMREILFIRKPDRSTEIWEGSKLGKEEASRLSGIKNVCWLEESDFVQQELSSFCKSIYSNKPNNPEDSEIILQNQNEKKQRNICHEDLAPFMMECRVIKEPEELDIIKKACRITEETFFELLKHIKPGVKEYELESYITFHFLYRAASGHSFSPIVASGGNALALHYQSNDGTCEDGDLLLLDFGCEYSNYASDCSRTLPVNGRFNKRQEKCYRAVLDVFEKAKKLYVQGNCIADINKAVNQLMEEQMINLGLLSQKEIENQNEDQPLFRKYYMHGVSHFVGLDAHDVGLTQIPFKPGMILTCEPGIYIKEENIGLRIETMLLITNADPIDLMPNLPSKPEEIERLLNANTALSV